MASPSDPTDSSRDPATDPETLPTNPNPPQKPTVEQGGETLNLESTQRDLEAVDQQPDPSIEESKNEDDETDAAQAVTSSNYRRGGGPKKKKGFLKKRKQQEKSREKLEVLLKTLKPIPFVPAKALDFSRHEKLLKTLGIWEFLHLEFDQNIRQDLVANLVAYYSPESRCSYVNGSRVNVTRADLARALKLPKKKDIVVAEEEREVLERDESAKFVDEILETWVLLHTDDMWIMPVEVVEWGRDVKEKKLEKLDWAALLWFMVEKELKAGPELGDCFFASHLQLLIRSQKEDLLREESNDDEEDDEDVRGADSGRDNCATDATELKEEETYVEEHMIELNLGQETVSEMVAEEQEQGPVEEQPMDVEEDKKEEVEKWSIATEGDEENNIEGPMEMGEDEQIEDLEEEETEEDKERNEGGFPFFPNGDSLHGDGMLGDVSPLRFASGLQMHGNSTGGHFLASRVDMHMAMGSGSNTNNKRQIDHENDMSYHNPDGKRMRTEEPSWDEKPQPVEVCVDQIVLWAEKARMSCAQKDRERAQSAMNQEYLMSELQRKDEMIHDLERSKYEEQQRKDLMIYRLESELRMMTSVLEGYRKALKETKKASAEHRKRCPLRDDKPVYKDVKGSGGLVLSVAEIEKLRLKREGEDKMTRARIERQIEEFGSEWFKVFQEQMDAVESLNERLIVVENEVKICREALSESKNDEPFEAVTADAATEET
ncbi:BnaA07g37920D [Brassica napus]|uniref:BnaA07g37920D protein n=1 Tax=Brassica napus TaxID=3708 RepID=A0A078J2C9_BRANA|nr:BnaA07g37920D [Brassica napus]